MNTPTSFSELGLPAKILQAVEAAGYLTPTPIQAEAIRPALAGRDVVGIAQTGTGKTAAFALPMLSRMLATKGTRSLIMAPTRELAIQIDDTFSKLSRGLGVRRAVVIGGAGMGPQITALRNRPDVVIATPGRLLDHMERKTLDLSQFSIVVLDEADRMLDMGFWPQIRRIFAALPKQRQTMLFSATMPPEITQLANGQMQKPVRIEIARSGTTAAGVSQRLFFVEEQQKVQLLLWLLGEEPGTVLVFTRTKHRADKVAKIVMGAGHKVERIHSNRSLNQRLRALEGFKSGKHRILIATDIAARGIDVANIAHIVNYDLPTVSEDYVHRIGRTARAETTGNATSFVSADQRKYLKAIERLLKAAVPVSPLPSGLSAFAPKAPPLRTPRPLAPTHTATHMPHGRPFQRPHANTAQRRPTNRPGTPDETWGFMPGSVRGKRRPDQRGNFGGPRRATGGSTPYIPIAPPNPGALPGVESFWESRKPIGPIPGQQNRRSGGGKFGGRKFNRGGHGGGRGGHGGQRRPR